MIMFSREEGFIKPTGIKFRDGQDPSIKLPKVAVGVFSKDLFDKIVENYKCYEAGYISIANGEKNIYVLEYENTLITLFMAGVGGPLVAGDIEDLHVNGVEKFIIFGNCGVLDSSIEDCSIIIPNLAYREDGCSYHYLKESETIPINLKYKDKFKKILQEHQFNYREGPTWTTDAFYRETKEKINYFKKKKVLTVEMETSTIAAVCNFKHLDYFTFYYAGDNLDGELWEERSISGLVKLDKKKEVVVLALELAKKIS